MLNSLRTCRPSLSVARSHRRPGVSAKYATKPFNPFTDTVAAPSSPSPTPPKPNTPFSNPTADLLDEIDDRPPTAGDTGYARTTTSGEAAPSTGAVDFGKLRHTVYHVHCFSSRNNTITTFTNEFGNPIAWFSGGSCGFKRGTRASYEAGYQCAVRMFKRIEATAEKEPLMRLHLFFKGFGQGREAMQKALMTSEGQFVKPLISEVVDRTPIKIGGTRAKKMRRL